MITQEPSRLVTLKKFTLSVVVSRLDAKPENLPKAVFSPASGRRRASLNSLLKNIRQQTVLRKSVTIRVSTEVLKPL